MLVTAVAVVSDPAMIATNPSDSANLSLGFTFSRLSSSSYFSQWVTNYTGKYDLSTHEIMVEIMGIRT